MFDKDLYVMKAHIDKKSENLPELDITDQYPFFGNYYFCEVRFLINLKYN